MKNTMTNKSESIKELAEALSLAQSEMKGAPMNATNPFLKNKYADLGSVIETARPVLAKNGMSFTQIVTTSENMLEVETLLMHKSGEWISGVIGLPMGDERGKSMAQVAGSIITYLRRYSLAAILGIYADEDTDGNAAHQQPQPAQKSSPLAQSNNAPLDDMSIEEAEREYSDHNKCFYGEVETDKLTFMYNSMKKVVRPTLEQERKIKAVEIILAARKAGRPVAKFATEVTPAEVDAWVAEQ